MEQNCIVNSSLDPLTCSIIALIGLLFATSEIVKLAKHLSCIMIAFNRLSLARRTGYEAERPKNTFNKRHKIVISPLDLLVTSPSQFIVLSAQRKLWILHTQNIVDHCSKRSELSLNLAALDSSCFTLAGPIPRSLTCFFPPPLRTRAHHPMLNLPRHQTLFTPFHETSQNSFLKRARR